MHYKGYDGHDAWLALDELKCKALPKSVKAPVPKRPEMDIRGLKKGMRLQAEADGQYGDPDIRQYVAARNKWNLDGEWFRKGASHYRYLADVDQLVDNEGAIAQKRVLVTFVGYEGRYDEWLGADRLRRGEGAGAGASVGHGPLTWAP